MKAWKFQAVPLLALILVLAAAGAVPGAILEKGSQVINLVTPLVNNGNLPFTGLNIRTTNGDTVPFTGTDQVLIITRLGWTFTATDPSVNYPVQLNIGDYFRSGAQLANGVGGNNDTTTPGFPVTNFSTNIYVCQENDPSLTPISGTLSMRLVGYLAPNQ